MPDELWTEVHGIVQEAVIKTITKKKKCRKAKWLSEEALQTAEKRREAKSKGEKERHTHLNAEFQRLARRDKKAFLSEQCKEVEEGNRMGKTTEWVDIPFSRGSSQPRDQIHISSISCVERQILYHCTTYKAPKMKKTLLHFFLIIIQLQTKRNIRIKLQILFIYS